MIKNVIVFHTPRETCKDLLSYPTRPASLAELKKISMELCLYSPLSLDGSMIRDTDIHTFTGCQSLCTVLPPSGATTNLTECNCRFVLRIAHKLQELVGLRSTPFYR